MARYFFALVVCVAFSSFSPLSAGIVTYIDPALFQADIAGRTITDIDFESATVGDTIADGGSFGGVTFNYSWTSGESIRINNDNSTTSGTNYLGATDGPFAADLLADFNDITFAPNAPFSAFGLFISAPFEPFDDDLVLSGSSALSGPASRGITGPPLQVLGDGSSTYFLGIATDDVTEALDPITLAAIPAAFGTEYRIDDIVFANAQLAVVPEPSSLLLFATCSLAVAGIRRKRRA